MDKITYDVNSLLLRLHNCRVQVLKSVISTPLGYSGQHCRHKRKGTLDSNNCTLRKNTGLNFDISALDTFHFKQHATKVGSLLMQGLCSKAMKLCSLSLELAHTMNKLPALVHILYRTYVNDFVDSCQLLYPMLKILRSLAYIYRK